MALETTSEKEWIVLRYGLSRKYLFCETEEVGDHQFRLFDAFLTLGDDLRIARQRLYSDMDLRRMDNQPVMLYINPCSAKETHDTLPQYQVSIEGNKYVFENILRRLFKYVGSPCWVVREKLLAPEESTVRKLEKILGEKGLRIDLSGCVERIDRAA